jgi:hypothetical protein
MSQIYGPIYTTVTMQLRCCVRLRALQLRRTVASPSMSTLSFIGHTTRITLKSASCSFNITFFF